MVAFVMVRVAEVESMYQYEEGRPMQAAAYVRLGRMAEARAAHTGGTRVTESEHEYGGSSGASCGAGAAHSSGPRQACVIETVASMISGYVYTVLHA